MNILTGTSTLPAGELTEGRLRPCPNRPNCVTSDSFSDGTDKNKIAPIRFQNSPEDAWQKIPLIIARLGGDICKTTSTYLWATYASKFFGFVDDVELRMEPENKVIHIRSGARVGYFDFNVNRRRVEKIRKLIAEQEPKDEQGNSTAEEAMKMKQEIYD
jgi:uncharacterized protein (DUF1499 family)